MAGRRVAGILFYDGNGNVLFQDRRKISKVGEQYGYFGGGIEKNESPEQALRREIREELNLELEEFYLFKHKIIDTLEETGQKLDYYIYLAPMPNMNSIKVEEGEIAFMKFEEAIKLKWLKEDLRVLKEIHTYLKSEGRIK